MAIKYLCSCDRYLNCSWLTLVFALLNWDIVAKFGQLVS
ncbi:hypothetical protein COO91_00369 [Nostoc flagelliforme CCNUN1]|uniref:Uncharacterized protein n=1 Tax=Nostoc flagelliforme CCNUN1 TaxID=2038116 RepID=A0A2K8SGF2_9NOSO|nr:hypothetical protein COO91_00369 [Nostoc flagelliforme CCNUN1]